MKIGSTTVIITINTLFILSALETGSYFFLKNKGIDAGLFITLNRQVESAGKSADEDRFKTIDPHLGYAYGSSESKIKALSKEFTWLDGFVIYRNNISDIRSLPAPIVLTLGGSTTDGVNYGHSWPEHLARIMREKGIAGTVVNGGAGGYSTNQELLKLLRDGVEFKPSLVISYSGINDRGRYSLLPHPMVHSYQRDLLGAITRSTAPPFLPSTVQALRFVTHKSNETQLDCTLGLATNRTLAQQYERNMKMMHAISVESGAQFIGFIQPYGYFRNTAEPKSARAKIENQKTLELYEEIVKLPEQIRYLRDATNVLSNHPEVYNSDRVHLSDEGDKIVAQHIFKEISPLLGW